MNLKSLVIKKIIFISLIILILSSIFTLIFFYIYQKQNSDVKTSPSFPVIIWEYRIHNNISNFITSSPLVIDFNNDSEKEIIICLSTIDEMNEAKSQVIALHGIDGTTIWNVKLARNLLGPIGITNYIENSTDFYLVVRDSNAIITMYPQNGTIVWSQFFFNVLSSPVIGDIDGDKKDEIILSSNEYIFALNSESGDILWSFFTEEGYSVTGTAALADIDNDGVLDVIIGGGNGKIYGLSGNNGTLLWSFQTNGKTIWTYKTLGKGVSSPILGDLDNNNKTDVLVYSSESCLYALNGINGKLLWKFQHTKSDFLNLAVQTPCLADIDNDGHIEIVSTQSFYESNWSVIYTLDNNLDNKMGFRSYWPNIYGNSKSQGNLLLIDQDSDTLSDYTENIIGSSSYNEDTDGDHLLDCYEINITNTSLVLSDSDGDGISDEKEDLDKDGLNNLEEYILGTNPLLKDTDFDFLPDNIDPFPFFPDGWFYWTFILSTITCCSYFVYRSKKRTINKVLIIKKNLRAKNNFYKR